MFFGTHHTKVILIHRELLVFCRIVFDKDDACLTFFCFVKAFETAFLEELYEIFVCQVANTPLYPYAIVLMFKHVLLHAITVKVTYLRILYLCLIDLSLRRFKKIAFFEPIL